VNGTDGWISDAFRRAGLVGAGDGTFTMEAKARGDAIGATVSNRWRRCELFMITFMARFLEFVMTCMLECLVESRDFLRLVDMVSK
jgi:hypothetical protein